MIIKFKTFQTTKIFGSFVGGCSDLCKVGFGFRPGLPFSLSYSIFPCANTVFWYISRRLRLDTGVVNGLYLNSPFSYRESIWCITWWHHPSYLPHGNASIITSFHAVHNILACDAQNRFFGVKYQFPLWSRTYIRVFTSTAEPHPSDNKSMINFILYRFPLLSALSAFRIALSWPKFVL